MDDELTLRRVMERMLKQMGCEVMLAADGEQAMELYRQATRDGPLQPPSTPVTVPGISGAIAITAGNRHTCALLTGGTAQCWGDNSYGALGSGSFAKSSTPVPVSGLTGAIAITAGYQHTCALLTDGSVQCWGNNGEGQLGKETINSSATPVSVVW